MPLNPRITTWHDKRVWLVGASSGIGEALALALAQEGARLALSARRLDPLSVVAARCGRGAEVVPLDVCDAAAWARASAQVQLAIGTPDVVIFNAGTYQPMRAWELSAELARRTLETNVLGVMQGVVSVLPAMLARGSGHLVIVGSVAGYSGLPRALVYGPSKAALINFAESLYLDLAPKGVGVTLVSPGFVATPLTAQNDFHMPALIPAAEAARCIVAGLARGVFEIHFPRRFSLFLKLLRCLPRGLYFRLLRPVARTHDEQGR